jgi:hypothetical protein
VFWVSFADSLAVALEAGGAGGGAGLAMHVLFAHSDSLLHSASEQHS